LRLFGVQLHCSVQIGKQSAAALGLKIAVATMAMPAELWDASILQLGFRSQNPFYFVCCVLSWKV
jgi:hypothetical protein